METALCKHKSLDGILAGKGLGTRTSEDCRGSVRWIYHCLGKVAADPREVTDPTVLDYIALIWLGWGTPEMWQDPRVTVG